MTRQSTIPARILAALTEFGPMTVAELTKTPQCRAYPNDTLRKRLARMTREDALQTAFILLWTHDAEGEREYPRAVYAAGRGKNKPRPKAKTRGRIVNEWKKKRKTMLTSSFVFNLGAKP